MKLIKNIAAGSLALLLVLVLAAGLMVTSATEGLLPSFLPVRGYLVQEDAFEGLLPMGSLAIVDPDAVIEAGHVVCDADGRMTVADGEGNLILAADPAVVYAQAEGTGRVIYRINGMGAALQLVQDHRMVVWGMMGLGTAGLLVWAAGAPKRRRKKEVQELIELFDYYGRKYDAEEEGIDY